MDIRKHIDLLNPDDTTEFIHIIGVGAIGSHLAIMLTRLGFSKFVIYDFDIVNEHNLANQHYEVEHVGKPKTLSIAKQMQRINPNTTIHLENEGYDHQDLSGYVFLAVDNIELRHDICKTQEVNQKIKAVFDFRMRLTDAQHYAAQWNNRKQVKNLIKSMDFTSKEATAATPVNACGSTLSIIPTVQTIVSLGVTNFINTIKGKPMKSVILIETFDHMMTTM